MSARTSSQSKPDPPPEELARKEQIKRLCRAIFRKPPYCQGTIPLSADDFILFYGKDLNAHRLNLADASLKNLQHLAGACDPATFGLGHENVYDETYRKAAKLDASDFTLRFTPDTLGLLDVVRAELLIEGRKLRQPIRAELYKMNVYGPGAFFKPHVDTPRSELMFGSLVIVFPTTHEGGALVLREDQRAESEWVFDSAALLAGAPQRSIAYVAFYSDVQHEVMPVQSGYRVAVTYNLYYAQEGDSEGDTPPQPVPTNEGMFRETLQGLLDDPTFLPEGGNLLFPLRHQYPISTTPQSDEKARLALQGVATRLKLSDALVLKIVRELGLDASMSVVYEERKESPGLGLTSLRYTMCDRIVRLDDIEFEEGYLEYAAGGVVLYPDIKPRQPWPPSMPGRIAYVNWTNADPWQVNSVKTTFMVYGNQAEIAHAYWKFSLFVRVGPAGERSAAEIRASSGN